jgi:hypothetical protein
VSRVLAVAAVIGVLATACTGDDEPPAAPTSAASVATSSACPRFVLDRNDGVCADTFELAGATYRVACVSVPEVLLDVPLDARWGGGAVRAIAAVPAAHAAAVTADDEQGCGAFAVALRTDLPDDVAEAIADELERAASLPPDLQK